MSRIEALRYAVVAGWSVTGKVYAFLRQPLSPGVTLDECTITHTVYLSDEAASK